MIVGFLEGRAPDHRGRILAILLQQTDHLQTMTQWGNYHVGFECVSVMLEF